MNLYPTLTGKEEINDEASAYGAVAKFYRAFNTQNMDLMQAQWLPTEEASMSNPLGGVKRGWEEIRQVYEHIFEGPAEVYVEYYDFSIHELGDMFCAVGKERGFLRIDNTEVALDIRTSRIYRQYKGEWRQLHHHGSMDDPARLQHYQSTVLASRA